METSVIIDGRSTRAACGETLFACAKRLEVRVPTSCFENGRCRECLVEVRRGADVLSPRTDEESHLGAGFRLACRTRIAESAGAVELETLKRGKLRIDEGRGGFGGPFAPAVRRDGDSVIIDGRRCPWSGPILGVAVDVGTTTVALRLVDLETGRLAGACSFENPQRFGGSDIMARIRFDEERGGKLLQRVLLGYLAHAIESLVLAARIPDGEHSGVDAASIAEIVIAGNSTMRDLFFGLDVRSIGQRPYRSLTEQELAAGKRTTTSLALPAKKLRLPAAPDARVYGLPLISGHVGADATACLLAVDACRATEPFALMDIGTNTELIVFNGKDWFAASCPAGPAFEGGSIACGMPGFDGAIETVGFDDAGGRIDLGVIGGGDAAGICGSGLVDTLSELLRSERMDELGRLSGGEERVVLDQRGRVWLSEADISELAQAKGANVAGIRIVLETAGLEVADLRRFWLAGGFASHLDVLSAQRIGLIPELDAARVVSLGNASIDGATIALLSAPRLAEIEALVRRIRHVELETSPSFFDHFVEGCLYKRLR